MRYRLLGRTGLRVSELFLGGTSFAGPEGSGATREHRAMFDAYAESGGNVIDTARAYPGSEPVLGELLHGRRDRFAVATKYGLARDGEDPNSAGTHRKSLMLSLEESLRRLRTDYIDLYWVHLWDRLTPAEETMRVLDDAVRAGKILYPGISNAPAWWIAHADTLARWRGWTPFAAIQVPYNLIKRDIERELLPMAEALGMSAATWRPLARGALSGRSAEALGERDRSAVHVLREVATDLGAAPAQVAIAWLRSRSPVVHPIVAASTAGQLRETLGSVELDPPEEALRRLDAAVETDPGYPADFIAECEEPPGAFGEAAARVDGRTRYLGG